MNIGLSGMARWLALAVFVTAAGCCYSCGLGGQTAGIIRGSESRAEPADGSEAGAGRGTASEAPGHAVPEEGPGLGTGEDSFGHAAGTGGEGVPGYAAQETGGAESLAPLAPEGAKEAEICFVHVCGEVEDPGVYELLQGQRVFEAVELAGGFTADAAENFLNLAEPVWDGMKILVPDKTMVPEDYEAGLLTGAGHDTSGPNAAGGGTAGGGDADKIQARVNINTAGKEELMTLRGIGQARAEDIISYRQQRGGFGSIEDIMEVPGIKDAAFQKIKDHITV